MMIDDILFGMMKKSNLFGKKEQKTVKSLYEEYIDKKEVYLSDFINTLLQLEEKSDSINSFKLLKECNFLNYIPPEAIKSFNISQIKVIDNFSIFEYTFYNGFIAGAEIIHDKIKGW